MKNKQEKTITRINPKTKSAVRSITKRKPLHKHHFFFPIAGTIAVLIGTYFAIQLGKGYRPTTEGLAGTGLLAANSFPPGAEVYINDKLSTATDDTLNLSPGEYNITIKKDGFIPWEKLLTIQQELVTQTNATLFKSVASLSPLTLSGATNIVPSPDGQKIAYAVASASAAAKNGLYVLELTSSNPLALQNSPKQIVRNSANLNFSEAQLLWSPSSNQILAHFEPTPGETSNYLLSPDSLNDAVTLRDVTARLNIILSEWEEDIVLRETKQFSLLPLELQQIATQSAVNVYFSPNEEKIMYTSTEYVTLPEKIIDAPPATSTQPQERELEPEGIYIFDLIEDTNFRIGSIDIDVPRIQKHLLLTSDYQQTDANADIFLQIDTKEPITRFNHLQDIYSFANTQANFHTHYSSLYVNGHQWYPDSYHILIKLEGKIDIMEYDRTNWITVYSGPFENDFVYPWPDGSKIIILTNLNPNSDLPHNLYAVDVK